jgi:hypothetical protein
MRVKQIILSFILLISLISIGLFSGIYIYCLKHSNILGISEKYRKIAEYAFIAFSLSSFLAFIFGIYLTIIANAISKLNKIFTLMFIIIIIIFYPFGSSIFKFFWG